MISLADSPQPARLEAELVELRERVAVLETERLALLDKHRTLEQELRVSQEKLMKVFTTSSSGISITTLTDSTFVDCNPSFCRIFGYSRDEVIGKSALTLNLWKRPEERARLRRELLEKGTVRVDELEFLNRRGEDRLVCVQFSLVEIQGEKHSIAVFSDITERKQGELALAASEARFREIFSESPIAIETYDAQGHLLEINRACLDLFGVVEPAEVKGHNLFLDPNVPADAKDRLARGETVRYEADFDFEAVKRAGLYRTKRSGIAHLSVSIACLGFPAATKGYLVQVVDVTARKWAENSLREERERLAGILRGTNAGTWEWNVQTGETIFNERWAEIIGYTLEELSPYSIKTWEGLCHQDDLKISGELLEKHFRGELKYYECEARMRHKSGEWVWVCDRGRVVSWTAEGKPLIMMGTHQDITARKAVQEALVGSESKYKQLFSRMSLGAALHRIVCDDAGRAVDYVTLEVNATFERIMGVHADAIVGRRASQALTPQELAERIDRFAPVALHGSTAAWEAYSPANKKWFMGDAYCPEPGCFVEIVADVTVEKQAANDQAALREQLHQAQKMDAIATLARGVAHDFNNILGGVLSGLSVLEFELRDLSDQHRSDLKDMMSLVQRGAELSKQLLGFSRRAKSDLVPRDLREVVQKTADLFSRTHRDITLELDLVPDLDRTLVDHVQLEQVLLNLFINAAHAMPNGGRLAIRGENATLTAAQTDPHEAKAGRFVKLVVSDSGTGIDPAHLPRIFEPFFTTKAPELGTGLGLASVYGIVRNHGGFVTVESEVGKGTTFAVLLPATHQPSAELPAKQTAVLPGRGTVLIVDDEERLLLLCARLLRGIGYQVLTASGGRAAVDLVQEHHDMISVVILDMTMPEMSGAATFDAIREVAPTMKVLLASGFAVDGHAQALLDRGCNGFIQKPFDAAALSEKLQAFN